ncbi:MAG: sigma-70 family RNA polymerase sigma factor [Phenylobacterium sp.]
MSAGRAMISTENQLRGLMVAALAGDGAAYRLLLAELSGYLRGYFARRLPDRSADVEDLVQETLMALHARRETYDTGRPLTAWVYAIARYRLADRLRARARREALNVELPEDLFAAPEQEAAEARRDVMVLLATLPEKQRNPIMLTKLEGLSVEEAAARTGMSVSAVKVSVHRGLKKLARLVGTP